MSKRAERAKRNIKRSLKLVPKEELERVVEEVNSEADDELDIVPEGKRPGDVVNGYKVPWTYEVMVKEFPIVTFTPEETIPLTWNGVKVQAYAQIEMHVPEPFKMIYDNHRREIGRKPSQTFKDGFINMIELGIGALEPLRK
jgi:hypothetical protein